MSTLAKAFVIGAMKADIAKVEKETWLSPRDRVCEGPGQKRVNQRHVDSGDAQAELCRQTYLATSRQRLDRYMKTGKIQSISAPTQLAP